MKIKNGKGIKLYYPNGELIPSIEIFIDFYSKCYYISNNKDVEDAIDDILNKGITSTIELFRILAWKLGKIDMKKSTKDAFVYYENMDEKSMQLRLYSKEDIIDNTDIEEIYNKIIKPSGKCDSDKEAQIFLNNIKNLTDKKDWGNYFYSVYMITLLYFVSKGKYPIVDSFSYVALDAIENNTPYGTRKSYPGLFGRDTNEYKEIVTKGNYAHYRDSLKEIFNEKANCRKVDQALWAYGKLFKK